MQETQLTPTGLRAKVKGNYKEFYTTEIAFGADRLGVQCSCPLEEKWCKHAVAVALSAVEQGLWEAFWSLPEVPPELEPVVAPQGLFQCQVQWPVATDARHLAKHVAVRLLERQRDAWLWQTEKTLQGYLKTLGGEELSPLLRGELGLLQWLVNEGFKQPNNPQGYFHIPLAQVGSLMERLALAEEVTDPHGNRLLVRPTPLQPHLYLGPQPNGSVNASLHWVEKGVGLTEAGTIKEEYPVEELQPLGPHVPWVLTNRRIFPLAGAMAKLPKALANNTFTEFVGQDAPKFLYEQLPTLKSNWGSALVVQDEELQGISREPKPPVACLAVEIIDPASLRTRSALTFNYEKVKVPFSRSKLEQPYLLVTTKKKDKSYWVARNLPLEHKAFQRLMDGGLQPVQANQFAADGDEAVDCYNFLLPQLEKESWAIHRVNEEHMGLLRLSPHPLKLVVRLEFDEAVTYFTLQVRATLGAKAFSLEEVQQHLLQGKKYFMASGLGFVEVPLHTVLSFNKVMQALDAETMEGGEKFKVPTYKAGLIAELEELGIELDMSRKFQRFWDVMTAGKPMEELRIPASVQAELRPYQERGFHWLWFLYSYGLNGVLADDMGLGKTLQALVVLQQAKEKHGRFPSLIVCPTTLVFNWKNEIERFTPGMKVVTLTGTERFDLYPEIKEADIVVTSYAILRRDINALKGYPFRFAILDEAQHIKNATSQTAEAAKLLQCQHRLALSGTPIENRLAELWSLFDFLMPGFLEDADQFRRRFILPIEERGSRDAESRLKRQVFPFILRRMKRDVLKDLPPKMEQVIYCDMGDNQRQLYLDILEKAKEELIEEAAAKGGKLNQQHVFAALTRLRQVCNHSSLVGAELSGGLHESGKFEALQELLEAAIANGHRILVFSQFVEMLKLVQSWLKRKGIK